MRWLLPLRRRRSATAYVNIVPWRCATTSTPSLCTTLDRCRTSSTTSIQVFAKFVWKRRRRPSSIANIALIGHHGTMGVAARSATIQSLGRSSSIRTSTRRCCWHSHSAVSAALEAVRLVGQAVVPAQVAQTAVARDGQVVWDGRHERSRDSHTVTEMAVHECTHNSRDKALHPV